MVVNEQKIFQFFSLSPAQFAVPLFQRYYEWGIPQWEKLWEDVESILQTGTKNHFFGAVVCQRIETGTGFSKFLVIDGQQRLTTISILLCLLRNAAYQRDMPDVAKKINNRFLVNADESGERFFRLHLSADGGDRQYYRQMIESAGVLPEAVKNNRLYEAYAFFERKLKGTHDVEHIWNSLICRFTVVSIVLDSDDNPYHVFESLNARGKSLTSADLIRNFIFMHLADDTDFQESMHNKYWLPMERQLGEVRLTEFMRHFLIMETGTFVKESDVYDRMCSYIKQSSMTLPDCLKMMSMFAGYYAVICGAVPDGCSRIAERFHRLNRLEYSVAYPFLLRLFGQYKEMMISEDEFVFTLMALETFRIRRLVCGIPSNGLNRVFTDLYKEAAARISEYPQCGMYGAVRHVLSKKMFPTDAEFTESLKKVKLYKAGKNEICRFILETLEDFLAGKETLDWNNPSITIEHILPQHLTQEWESHLGCDASQIYEKYLHTIGNLTLTGYNGELSDSTFPDKRERLANSNLHLNRYFSTVNQWTEKEIRERAGLLAETALTIWNDLR